MTPGGAGAVTVTITRVGGYAGDVTLALDSPPTGVTATFTPATLTGSVTTSTLTLSASATAAATNALTVRAAGTGVTAQSATLSLTVALSGGSVLYKFCGETPTFFAYRNGSSGGWTALTVGANNTFSFTLSQGTGQIAYATPGASGAVDVQVQQFAATEFTAYSSFACAGNTGTNTVAGTVAGLNSAGSFMRIAFGGTSARAIQNGAFTIDRVQAGPSDLIASRLVPDITTNNAGVVDKIILRRSVSPAAGGSVGPVIDFAASEAVAPAPATYAISNSDNTEFIWGNVIFSTANGASITWQTFNLAGGTTSTPLYGVPSTLTRAGDFHAVSVTAFKPAISDTASRTAGIYTKNVAPAALILGAPATSPTVNTSATAPYARVRSQGPWQAEYPDAVTTVFVQSSGSKTWTITASRAYFGGSSTTYDLDVPDLSAVSGFNNAWGLVAGASTAYRFQVFAGLGGLTGITEGSTFKRSGRFTTITP